MKIFSNQPFYFRMMSEYQPITLIDGKKNGGSKVNAEAVSLYSEVPLLHLIFSADSSLS